VVSVVVVSAWGASVSPVPQAESKAADAASIDAVYIRNQQAAHDAALALHRAYATGGDTPGLKAAAGEIVPVIEKHIAELQKLAQAEPDDAG